MRKTTKMWFLTATSLILIGCIVFGGVMCVLKWDFTKLSTGRYESNQHEITEKFNNISIETNTADVDFALSDDGKCRVECYEKRKSKHAVTVREDTLVIAVMDNRSWYDYIGINFGSPEITVYLPKAEYAALVVNQNAGDVAIPKDFRFEGADLSLGTGDVNFFACATGLIRMKTSAGNVRVENISAGALDLSASTGRIVVSNVTCAGDININVSTGKTRLHNVEGKNLMSSGKTGDISLKNVMIAEKISVKRSTGDVSFDRTDASEVFAETDTGDVVGSLLTNKVFITHTDAGRVDVPKSAVGGKCEICTDTGDIKITVEQFVD